jgi:hypothetical protein
MKPETPLFFLLKVLKSIILRTYYVKRSNMEDLDEILEKRM